eukprot:4604672-Amphidinium_carterae.1
MKDRGQKVACKVMVATSQEQAVTLASGHGCQASFEQQRQPLTHGAAKDLSFEAAMSQSIVKSALTCHNQPLAQSRDLTLHMRPWIHSRDPESPRKADDCLLQSKSIMNWHFCMTQHCGRCKLSGTKVAIMEDGGWQKRLFLSNGFCCTYNSRRNEYSGSAFLFLCRHCNSKCHGFPQCQCSFRTACCAGHLLFWLRRGGMPMPLVTQKEVAKEDGQHRGVAAMLKASSGDRPLSVGGPPMAVLAAVAWLVKKKSLLRRILDNWNATLIYCALKEDYGQKKSPGN